MNSSMFLILVAVSSPFVPDSKHATDDGTPMPNAVHYAGSATLAGEYSMFEEGALCFTPSAAGRKLIPLADRKTRICFVEGRGADALLGVSTAETQIDTVKTCGFKGSATITISDLWSGQDNSGRWHSAVLTKVSSKTAPRLVSCK